MREEFSENSSASTFMSFFFCSYFCLFFFVRMVGRGFPEIFLIIIQIVLVWVEEPSWLTQFFQLFFLASLISFHVFAQRSLKSWRLVVVGFLLNLRTTALRRRIAFLQSSLNQGVLCLFEVEVLAIDSFAINIFFGLRCSGLGRVFCSQRVSKTSQFALFSFQWVSLSTSKGCQIF